VIVTLVPTGPLEEDRDEIEGAAADATTVNDPLVAVPPGVVTANGPLVAPVGTNACTCDADTTVNCAARPASVTAVAPDRFAPEIVTLVPTGPLVGDNDEIDGAATGTTTVKDPLVAVPPGVVTAKEPFEAPDGTVARTCDADTTVNCAARPASVTAVAPDRFAPEIVTLVPTGPLVGDNDEIDGAATGGGAAQAE